MCAMFIQDSFKTERPVCVATDGQSNIASWTTLSMLIQNIVYGVEISYDTLPNLGQNKYTVSKTLKC